MHIVQLVTKNTSSLDFSLPLYWGLRATGVKFQAVVLICAVHKSQILGKSEYYERELKKLNIQLVDYSDLLLQRGSFFLSYLLQAFRFFSNIFVDDQRNLNQSLGTETIVSKIFRRVYNYGMAFAFSSLNFSNTLKLDSVDFVILDNRERADFLLSRRLNNQIFNSDPIKLVTPHAPHYIDEYFSFVRVNPYGPQMVSDCDIWLPFHLSRPELKHPHLKKQFFRSGYPGLDEAWLNHCRGDAQGTRKYVKCLVIGRKFLPKNVTQKKSDLVTLEYGQVLTDLEKIKDAFESCDKAVELIFKLHPSGDLGLAKQVLIDAKIENFTVTTEPLYSCIADVDLVISPYSTAVMITAMSGIPTVILRSELQEQINAHWIKIREMYEGMSFYVDYDCLTSTIKKILVDDNCGSADVNFLRHYFEDGAINRCVSRLLNLVASRGASN
jgi:hypothetical protein